jgi:hypothetical protein
MWPNQLGMFKDQLVWLLKDNFSKKIQDEIYFLNIKMTIYWIDLS